MLADGTSAASSHSGAWSDGGLRCLEWRGTHRHRRDALPLRVALQSEALLAEGSRGILTERSSKCQQPTKLLAGGTATYSSQDGGGQQARPVAFLSQSTPAIAATLKGKSATTRCSYVPGRASLIGPRSGTTSGMARSSARTPPKKKSPEPTWLRHSALRGAFPYLAQSRVKL